MKATTKSQMLVRLAFATYLFITPVVLTSCEKEDPIKPTPPPVVTVKLSTSIKALPIDFNSSKVSTVPYFGKLDITITTNIASTVTASVPADSVSVSGNSTTFTYRNLTADKFIEFVAVAGTNDRVVETATIKVTQPTADEKMIVGKYRELKMITEDYVPPLYDKLVWGPGPLSSEISTYGADKSLVIVEPRYTLNTKWNIFTQDGVRYIKRGDGTFTEILEELTPTYMVIYTKLTKKQIDAGYRSSKVTLIRIE